VKLGLELQKGWEDNLETPVHITLSSVILFRRLFNNAFSIETIQCQMGRSQINDDELARAGKYYPEICLEGLRKTMKTFCQNS
jgi:hypothetical protein